LKATVKSFKALERVEQLHSGLPHGIARFTKLIGVPDGEFDPVNGYASLIRHLKFDRRRPRLDIGFDGLNDLPHDF
jgi:hypothetical protein